MKLRYLYQTRVRFLGEKCLSVIPSGITVFINMLSVIKTCFGVIKSSVEEIHCKCLISFYAVAGLAKRPLNLFRNVFVGPH